MGREISFVSMESPCTWREETPIAASLQILQKWVRRVGVLRSRDRRIEIETSDRGRRGKERETGENWKFGDSRRRKPVTGIKRCRTMEPPAGCNSSLAVDL